MNTLAGGVLLLLLLLVLLSPFHIVNVSPCMV